MNTATATNTAAKNTRAPSDTTIKDANGSTTAVVKAKKPRTAAPRQTAAQKRQAQIDSITAAVQKACSRLAYVTTPGAFDPHVVAVAVTNSVLTSIANALTAKVKLSGSDVLGIARQFMVSAGVEEVESPMGGTTLQRVKEAASQ